MLVGDELCAQIRNRSWTMPIILLLSASCTATHRIQSLDSGADDCLDETIEFNELLAHIRALLRRPRSLLTDVLIYQDLVLHVRDQSVSIGSHQLQLTKKEYMILHYLLRNKGKIVSRIDLLEHVWDSGIDQFSNTLETHISSLRRKITRAKPSLRVIQTVSGRGYRISS
jgi:two-component system copper resistance phosphate regulon response regulator CusR